MLRKLRNGTVTQEGIVISILMSVVFAATKQMFRAPDNTISSVQNVSVLGITENFGTGYIAAGFNRSQIVKRSEIAAVAKTWADKFNFSAASIDAPKNRLRRHK